MLLSLSFPGTVESRLDFTCPREGRCDGPAHMSHTLSFVLTEKTTSASYVTEVGQRGRIIDTRTRADTSTHQCRTQAEANGGLNLTFL